MHRRNLMYKLPGCNVIDLFYLTCPPSAGKFRPSGDWARLRFCPVEFSRRSNKIKSWKFCETRKSSLTRVEGPMAICINEALSAVSHLTWPNELRDVVALRVTARRRSAKLVLLADNALLFHSGE